ncbi:MAG: LysR family transcriptional regulator [Rhodobacterales bacterium]|nr:LysR family transcriptional regulator [Rhodobacterales bacterium]
MDWRRMPPLTALRAFEATARLSGFSQAARELNVTHAAVAQQVRALEDHLGQSLVRREGRALVLTEAGSRLAQALGEGFSTIQAGVEALQAGQAERPVRISLTTAFAAQWLMPRLRDFWDKHPDIGLSLHPDPHVVDLRREGMDLAIRFGNGQWPGLDSRFLTSARLVIVGTPDLTGGRSDLTADEMSALPWIISEDWPELPDWLAAQGIRPDPDLVAAFPTEDLALAAARQGLGLMVESMALVEDDLDTGRLVLVRDGAEALPGYFIVTPQGPQRPAVKRFLAWLRAQS